MQAAWVVSPIDRLMAPLHFLSKMAMEGLVHRTSKPETWSGMQPSCKERPGNYPFGFARQTDAPEVEAEGAVTVVTLDRLNIPWKVDEGDVPSVVDIRHPSRYGSLGTDSEAASPSVSPKC